MAIYSGFSHWTWWFSIAMLVYQRVDRFAEWRCNSEPGCQVSPTTTHIKDTDINWYNQNIHSTISTIGKMFWLMFVYPTAKLDISFARISQTDQTKSKNNSLTENHVEVSFIVALDLLILVLVSWLLNLPGYRKDLTSPPSILAPKNPAGAVCVNSCAVLVPLKSSEKGATSRISSKRAGCGGRLMGLVPYLPWSKHGCSPWSSQHREWDSCENGCIYIYIIILRVCILYIYIYLYMNLYLWGHDHLFYGNNVLTMAHVAGPKASVPILVISPVIASALKWVKKPQIDANSTLWIQTLSEKVLNPPNYTPNTS